MAQATSRPLRGAAPSRHPVPRPARPSGSAVFAVIAALLLPACARAADSLGARAFEGLPPRAPDPSEGSPYGGLHLWWWAVFIGIVATLLFVDLFVLHRHARRDSLRASVAWSAVCVGTGLLFSFFVYYVRGHQAALSYLTAFLVEESLSVDNLFVFLAIFGYFGVKPEYQHRVLFWGILSALVMRAIMIFAGSALLDRFHWLIYVFGAFLIVTGIKLFLHRNHRQRPEDGRVLRLARRVIPSTSRFDGSRFLTIENGRRVATPLLMALILVEVTDVIFAVDSIPAIFAVTRDPFIVFTSNIFAILGLRSLYFLLAGMMDRFRYLKTGLAAVLVFVGAKMALADAWKVPALLSLGVILVILGVAVWASLRAARGSGAASAAGHSGGSNRLSS